MKQIEIENLKEHPKLPVCDSYEIDWIIYPLVNIQLSIEEVEFMTRENVKLNDLKAHAGLKIEKPGRFLARCYNEAGNEIDEVFFDMNDFSGYEKLFENLIFHSVNETHLKSIHIDCFHEVILITAIPHFYE